MPDFAAEKLFLTHYSNLQALSQKQLEAIQNGDDININACIEQKQLIIEHIQNLQTELGSLRYSETAREKVEQLLKNIAAMEEQSRELLTERQEKLRLEMVVINKTKTLQTAYEGTYAAGNLINRSK